MSTAQVANAAPAGPTLPPGTTNIAVPAGNKVSLVAKTKDGDAFQIYQCKATPNTPNSLFTWTFVEPRATLIADNGQVINHFVGPTWQAKGGSKVVGQVPADASAPDPTAIPPTAIPWLRLKAASTTPGQLGNTTYIQRVATTGGLAPDPAGCTAETAGQIKEVPTPPTITSGRGRVSPAPDVLRTPRWCGTLLASDQLELCRKRRAEAVGVTQAFNS